MAFASEQKDYFNKVSEIMREKCLRNPQKCSQTCPRNYCEIILELLSRNFQKIEKNAKISQKFWLVVLLPDYVVEEW